MVERYLSVSNDFSDIFPTFRILDFTYYLIKQSVARLTQTLEWIFLVPSGVSRDAFDINNLWLTLPQSSRDFWSGYSSGSQITLDMSEISIQKNFKETSSYFDPDKNHSKNVYQIYLEIMRSFQPWIRNDIL